MAKQSARMSAYRLALYGMLGALMFGCKMAMMGLPNVEPVSLLVMLFAVTFGWQCLYPVYTYVLLEILVFGIHYWSVNYLYVWLVPVAAAITLREMRHPLGWAVLSGFFGLLFGALCAPLYLLTGGPAYALSWWIRGIPYDLIHGASNFCIALVLFSPLRTWLTRLERRLKE